MPASPSQDTVESPDLDRMDLKILSHLERDSSLTNAKLSEVIALSPSACLQRVRRLERLGIIRRYIAEIDWSRVRRQIRVFAQVTLKNHGLADFQEFERLARNHPDIVECYGLCGEADYILQFVCEDLASYQDASDTLLAAGIPIRNISSHAVIREIKA
jgi:DNA-binding Lrp family transcriptional regulator